MDGKKTTSHPTAHLFILRGSVPEPRTGRDGATEGQGPNGRAHGPEELAFQGGATAELHKGHLGRNRMVVERVMTRLGEATGRKEHGAARVRGDRNSTVQSCVVGMHRRMRRWHPKNGIQHPDHEACGRLWVIRSRAMPILSKPKDATTAR